MDGDGFQSRLLAFGLLDQGELVAATLAPALIHAQQHFRPVLRLGAAGAGVDFQEGVKLVGLAGEQAFDFLAFGLDGQSLQRGHTIGHHGGVGLGRGPLDQFDGIGGLALDAQHIVDAGLKLVALTHQNLSGGCVIPQRGVLGAVVQLLKTGIGDIPVKDASSAAPSTA